MSDARSVYTGSLSTICGSRGKSWVCTLAPHHHGWHVAHAFQDICAWWEQDWPESVRLPEGI